jgi:hypothetical protein
MRKPVELFFFFSISNTAAFKAKLKRDILPLVISTTQILSNVTAAPSTLVNIAFSHTGLVALSVTGKANNLNDPPFAAGQVNDAKSRRPGNDELGLAIRRHEHPRCYPLWVRYGT